MVKIYVACHNDKSEEIANKCAKEHSSDVMKYIVVRFTDPSPYFESQMFIHLEKIRDEWKDEDYVGLVTYSFFEKMSGKIDMVKEINTFRESDKDVLSLYNFKFVKMSTKQMVSFVETIGFQHGTFAWMIMYNILKTIGRYTDEQLFDKNIQSFMSNWWLAKPDWMMKYIMFCKKCMRFVESNKQVKEFMCEPSYYTGALQNVPTKERDVLNEERLKGIFNRPYYTLQPFIFERLPCFFFHIEGAKIHQSSVQCLFRFWE